MISETRTKNKRPARQITEAAEADMSYRNFGELFAVDMVKSFSGLMHIFSSSSPHPPDSYVVNIKLSSLKCNNEVCSIDG